MDKHSKHSTKPFIEVLMQYHASYQLHSSFTERALCNSPDFINVQHSDSIGTLPIAADAA